MRADPFNPWMRPMMIVRDLCIGSFVLVVMLAIFLPRVSAHPIPGLSMQTIILAGTLLIGICMLGLMVMVFLAGRHERGVSYGIGHAALVLMLSLFLFGLGAIIVPSLVRSDLEKRRRAAALMPPAECECCGYDLRATPPEGHCPECGRLVAESMRHEEARSEAG